MKVSLIPTPKEFFTNSHDFLRMFQSQVDNKTDTVRISTYNIGILEHDSDVLPGFIHSCCYARKVQLLVGINRLHAAREKIFSRLLTFKRRYPNLDIRTLEKVHAKIYSVDDSLAYSGSLNVSHPSLFDFMVKLNSVQRKAAIDFFTILWNGATILK